jgi:hypothetical protein
MFLHSALVLSRDINVRKPAQVREANLYFAVESAGMRAPSRRPPKGAPLMVSAGALMVSFLINIAIMAVFANVFFYGELAASFAGSGLVRTPGLQEAGIVDANPSHTGRGMTNGPIQRRPSSNCSGTRRATSGRSACWQRGRPPS